VTRTTTNTVDTAGRLTGTAMTGGTGTATPATTFTYNTTNGWIATRAANSQTISYGYDALGRRLTYTDGTGNTSTTAYDPLDRPVKTTDSAPSTVTYAYGTTDTLTTLTDSVAGTFTGTYNADGTLTSETLPGGHTLTVATDPTGQETGREYTTSDGTSIASDTAGYTVTGLQADHIQTDGSTTQTDYTYDTMGRLNKAADTTATGCITRAYAFDANSNRTALTATSDDCDSTTTDDATTTTTSSTYDSADRLVNSGYVYDAFGRTTTSGATTLGYYTNDMVATETLGTSRNTWTTDGAGRLAVQTAQTQATDGTWSTSSTTTSHYGGGSDSPTWAKTGDTVRRNVHDLTGGLSATTTASGGTVLQLANIHGDLMAQQPLDTSVASTVQHYDEYGNALDATAATTYSWLGTHQRSSATLSGYTLMGVRAYDPATGRFLQVDPVYGGNSNPYLCPGDPVNFKDISGLKKNLNKTSCGIAICTRYINHKNTQKLIDFFEMLVGVMTGVAAIAAAVVHYYPLPQCKAIGGAVAIIAAAVGGTAQAMASYIGWLDKRNDGKGIKLKYTKYGRVPFYLWSQ